MDTPPAYAHHSHPYFYDQCRTVTIEGRVEQIDWKNPHTIIVVTHEHGDHVMGVIRTPYLAELAPKTILTRAQVTKVVVSGPNLSGTRVWIGRK